MLSVVVFFFSSRRRHTRYWRDWSSDVCSSDLYDPIYNKEGRRKNAIYVEHGEPLVFGENNEYGLMQEGFVLKVVKIGENGVTLDDILIHDAHCQDDTLQLKLAMMDNEHGCPVALGIISRSEERRVGK